MLPVSCITRLHCELSLTFIFGNKAGVLLLLLLLLSLIIHAH